MTEEILHFRIIECGENKVVSITELFHKLGAHMCVCVCVCIYIYIYIYIFIHI
jgi:hypothetical protein